jgi:hypothetical protein
MPHYIILHCVMSYHNILNCVLVNCIIWEGDVPVHVSREPNLNTAQTLHRKKPNWYLYISSKPKKSKEVVPVES